ncbi:MAG: hypothetical protein RHS_2498 [Robinsoniella sp. RHS]|nr:MAG: hypothetical protein RHS_2498 [Robinsoniella sp. RHS]
MEEKEAQNSIKSNKLNTKAFLYLNAIMTKKNEKANYKPYIIVFFHILFEI